MITKKFTKRLKFKNWPNHTIPSVAAGAYVIWQGGELLYAGMSGREIEKAIKNGKKKYGLSTRLASHASGRLSGDPFCEFVTKKFIRTKLDYQYLLVERSQDAHDLANHCRNGAIFGIKPTFNPI